MRVRGTSTENVTTSKDDEDDEVDDVDDDSSIRPLSLKAQPEAKLGVIFS